MDRLDDVGDAEDGIDGEALQAVNVGQAEVIALHDQGRSLFQNVSKKGAKPCNRVRRYLRAMTVAISKNAMGCGTRSYGGLAHVHFDASNSARIALMSQ